MNNLYEALEICLREIEAGADVDTVLFRYPELAEELRPILEASINAKAMAVSAPTEEIVKRNRAKVLQRAAEMREQKAAPIARRAWSVPLRRALVTLMVVATLFVSGTGLVRAASATLPGDNLYPVKRTWEDIRLLFTFDTQKRDALELEHDNERLDELQELFAEGRSAKVDFAGYVTSQAGTEWRVSGISVVVSSQTRMPETQVAVGAAVRVRGQTRGDGVVIAERIELLPQGSKLPEAEDHGSEIEQENSGNSNQQIEEDSGKESENEAPKPEATKTPKPESESEPEKESVEGSVTSIQNGFVIVNGILMDIRFAAEIKGTPRAGVIARVEGYYDSSGVFIVTKIEFKNDSSIENGSNTNDDNDKDDDNGSNSGSGGGDDNVNDNENKNDNSNDNKNDNSNSNDD
ncbi:MAG: hypothetical protein C3F07_12210 [Anaerolineales bacterium]|nr:hypothetical protein [Anaerolineae bacterium]PWB72331.1 MAG: hypothetical protein C3F07_12210 [Anaerolineales bacterium]